MKMQSPSIADRRCAVMGIVNVTPDSFSDGNRYFRPEEAIRRAHNLVAEGADVIDLGGESTRPGATPLNWKEEWCRLEPVITELAKDSALRLSVDTYHPETAERALAAGVAIVNCVKAETVPAMVRLVAASRSTELVVPAHVCDGALRVGASSADVLALLDQTRLWLDPMVGFGTTRDEDLALLTSLRDLASFGRVLLGVSRKRIVRRLSGESGVGRLLGGSLALALWGAASGVSMVRVHDVRETVEALCAWTTVIDNCKGDGGRFKS